jgi:hypothetical protein
MISEVLSEVMRFSDTADGHHAKPAQLVEEAQMGNPPFAAPTVQQAVSSLSPWVRAAELPKLFSSWDLAYRCTSGGWLKPILKGKRRTIYRLADVLNCMQRIEAGEMPPSRDCKRQR